MVAKYGMDDDIGQILFMDRDDESMRWRRYSEETAKKLDTTIRTIITDCYTQAKKIITDEKVRIESMKDALLEKEYLTKDEFEEQMQRA
jgi:cell division protease FtsH